MRELHRVYIVGHFSSCPLIGKTIRAELEQLTCRVLVERNPDLTILRGAVLYSSSRSVFKSTAPG